MSMTVKVLTLNCWGVFTPFACQYRAERMVAVGKELSKAEHDIVMLQEIWTQGDYETLCTMITPTMPHTHYFHGGMYGSGVCIFSKYPILETFLHRFSLNGYAHKLQHGDWFCGKGIGLAKIRINDMMINFYSTHLHAEYNETSDEYLAHRVAQAYEMSQFIKMTSTTCDAVIVGGDFNLQPKNLGYKLITTNANLQDAWLTQEAEPEDDGHGGTTCDRPDNMFASKDVLQNWDPHGLRLDYLMFRANQGYKMACEKCFLTMRQVPGEKFPYSDHEGLAGVFTFNNDTLAGAPKRDTGAIEKHFVDSLPILDRGVKKVRADQVFYGIALFISLVFLIYTSDLDIPLGLGFLLIALRFLITLCIGYFFWMAVIMANWELNGLLATKKDISNLLKVNHA